MGVRRISEPEVEPVSLDEAKDHLNFDSDEKDDLISIYISAARAHVENFCHIVVAESEWELTYDAFPSGAIEIPKSPLIEVTAISYDDADDNEQTLEAGGDFVVDTSQAFGRVVPIESWPASNGLTNSVRISFTIGWPNDSNVSTVPADLKQAVLLLVGHFFDNREGASAQSIAAVPLGVEALISKYRVPVIA